MTSQSLSDVQLGYVDTYEDVELFFRWLGERRPVIAADSETTGLSPYAADARVRLIQFGDAQTGWAIPWHKWPGLAHEVFSRYDGPIVFHNAGFDAKYLSVQAPELRLPWGQMQDTMILARLAEPDKSAALKRLASELYGPQAALGQRMLASAMDENDWTWESVPFEYEGYTVYSAMDVVLTARLWDHFQPWLSVGRNREVYELEMQVRRICTEMELRGCRVDLEYCGSKKQQLEQDAARRAAWGREALDIDLGSSRQLAQWVADNGGMVQKLTPRGNPSVDKDELKRLLAEDDTPDRVKTVVGQALWLRKAEKLAGTYFANFLRHNRDGLLHPDINPLAARTSRMSIKSPALQTLNRDDLTVRDAFIPLHENEGIVSCDYSQIEMRLIAHFSKDQHMLDAFRKADGENGDFFTEMGRRIYGDDFERSDKRRGLVKNTLYSSGYGAGIAKMALTARVPLHQMKEVADAVFATYPGIKSLQRDMYYQLQRNSALEGESFVVTPLGRKLPVDELRGYTATNYFIQGHAAEVLKQALCNLDNMGLCDYAMIPIHDEVLFSVPLDIVEDVKHGIREAMTMHDYSIDLPADPDGPFQKWGDAKR